ncbi:MAG: hypothetical protein WB696_31845 [Chthoniobacterales bacterium]
MKSPDFGSVLSVAFCYRELKERKGAATILATPAAPQRREMISDW